MKLLRALGIKLLLTDLDGTLGDCKRAAYEISPEVGKVYTECKNNPSLLQEKLSKYNSNLETIMEKLAENFEIYPGVTKTLRTLKSIGYVNLICTDNPVFGLERNRIKFENNLNSSYKCIDEIHPTIIPKIENGELKIIENGSKDSHVRKNFSLYEEGLLVVDDKNDIKAVEEAKKLREDHGFEITIIKVGNNCKKLDEYVDYSVKNFNEILKFA